MQRIVKFYYLIGFVVFFLLVWADVVVVKNPSVGKIATVLWFVSFGYVTVFAIKCWIDIIKHLAGFKTVFTVLLLIIWFVILVINVGKTINISGETTQEINCALNHLSTSADRGYGKSCFLGHPAKQHLLMALPSIFLGRSLISLNSGTGLYFMLGLIIFSGGILKYFHYRRHGDLIVAILLSSIFHFYYVNHYLFLFEQNILPVIFGFIITGIFLYYLADRKNLPLYLIGLLLLYLIFSYTPSLALYFLSICILVYLLFDRKISKRQKLLLLFIIILTLISYYFSLKFRIDIKIVSVKIRNQEQLVDDVIQTFHHLLNQKGGNPIVSPMYNFIFVTIIVISSLVIFGWKYTLISYWIIGVIILAVVSQGYAYYSLDLRLSRASVIFPVFLAMLVILSKRFHFEDKNRYLFGIMIVILSTGLYFQNTILDAREPSKHLLFINWLRRSHIASQQSKQKINLYFINDADRNYISINDEMQYFIPQLTKAQYSPKNCQIEDIPRGFFVLRTDDGCYTSFANSHLVNYGRYDYKDDNLGVFEKR